MQRQRVQNEEVQQTILSFAAFLTSIGRKQSTIKRYVYDIEDFLSWVTKYKDPSLNNIWASLSTQDYENYFFELQSNRNYSDKTIHRVYIVLNRIYFFLQQSRPSLENPLQSIEMITQPDRALRKEDFISEKEERQLMKTIISLKGLSEKQLSARPFLIDRNQSIISLMLDYGLSLQELTSLTMQGVHFERNMLSVPPVTGKARTITLEKEDKQILYRYYKTIPEAVRPKYHSQDPLFVAFDFNRNTYKWVYEQDAPKELTEIAIQKMIRLEVIRAGIRKGISAQHFRNTYILRLVQKGENEDIIMKLVGFKTKLSLKRFLAFEKNKEETTKG